MFGQLQSLHILTVNVCMASTAFSPLARIKSAGIPSTPGAFLRFRCRIAELTSRYDGTAMLAIYY